MSFVELHYLWNSFFLEFTIYRILDFLEIQSSENDIIKEFLEMWNCRICGSEELLNYIKSKTTGNACI